ncbi:diacylglycerol kinase [Helcococcus sueciensis]|uniref:diacylglycerol kinase n=1 Tax=Helcococcus sueciensis TaxID=241555 RepID=UPI00040338FC|nr:diacylglycerol kinase [Helcococcus sueciensis]
MKPYDDKESKKIKNNSKLIDSFNNAINGIIQSVSSERNMIIHIVLAIGILSGSFFLNFTRIELIIVAITIVLVLCAELFNTAIETLTDLVTDNKYHILAKRVKDISAGAVLLTAINAVIVGYLLIYPKVKQILEGNSVVERVIKNKEHLAVLSIALVLILVLLLKGIFYKKDTTHLFGGSVSGHSALAFNIATIGSIISRDFSITFLLVSLAILVAESRYESGIHTKKEVIIGSFLGVLIALGLFSVHL